MRLNLKKGKTLAFLIAQAKEDGHKNLAFYTSDGAVMAKSTKLDILLTLPYFKISIDSHKDYIVISDMKFSYNNSKFLLEGNVKKYYDYCINELNMDDDTAIVLSNFSSDLLSDVVKHKDMTREEFVKKSCQILVNQANEVNMERKILTTQLELLKSQGT